MFTSYAIDPAIVISGIALLVSFFAVVIQGMELRAQRRELQQTRVANEISSRALIMQAELQAIATRIEAETHLHAWNNAQAVDESLPLKSREQKKRFAQDNFFKIQELKGMLDERLNGIAIRFK